MMKKAFVVSALCTLLFLFITGGRWLMKRMALEFLTTSVPRYWILLIAVIERLMRPPVSQQPAQSSRSTPE